MSEPFGEPFDVRTVRIVNADADALPWALLLDADPSRPAVESYLDPKWTRTAWHDGRVVGVYVLKRRTDTRWAVMNIAIANGYRGRGLGRWLLYHAIGLAETKGARIVEASAASAGAAAFLERSGFRVAAAGEHGPVRLTLELTPE